MHRECVAHRFALRRELTLRDGSAGVSLALHLPAPACKQARPLSLAALARRSRPALGACGAHAGVRCRSLTGPSRPRRAGAGLRPRAQTKRRLQPPARAPHCARQTQPVRARPGARHPTRRRAARSRQAARLPSLDTATPAPRVADSSRSATASALAWPGNHRFAPRLTLALAHRRRTAPAPANRSARLAPPARAPRCTRQAQPDRAQPRRSAPHAKPRGAVTPSCETSLARYNTTPAPRVANSSRSATAAAFGLAWKPPLRGSLDARTCASAPRSARARQHNRAPHAARLTPPARAPRCTRQAQPVRARPGARHPARSRGPRVHPPEALADASLPGDQHPGVALHPLLAAPRVFSLLPTPRGRASAWPLFCAAARADPRHREEEGSAARVIRGDRETVPSSLRSSAEQAP